MIAILIAWALISDPFEEGSILISTVPGIKLEELEGGGFELSGFIERLSDQRKVLDFLKRNPEVKNQTKLSKGLIGSIQRKLEKELRTLGLHAKVNRTGSTFVVNGSGVDSSVLARLRKIYSGVEAHQKQKRQPSSLEPTIFIEVALIEVKKTAFEKLGLRMDSPLTLEGQLGMSFLSGGRNRAEAGMGDPLRLFLDLAMQEGEARVHAKQSVVAQNGERGEFQAGGEFPIKIVQGMVSRVEFKQYGLILKFTPNLRQSPYVHIQIESEMSEIDTGALVDGIPTISKKDLKTQLTTRLDEMVAIGGIVRSSQSNHVDSIPGLSAIPIFGRLFQSEDFKKHKSEAYLFITPRKLDRGWLPSFEL